MFSCKTSWNNLTAVCSTIAHGVFALFGFSNESTRAAIDAFTRAFHMPYVTPNTPVNDTVVRPGSTTLSGGEAEATRSTCDQCSTAPWSTSSGIIAGKISHTSTIPMTVCGTGFTWMVIELVIHPSNRRHCPEERALHRECEQD